MSSFGWPGCSVAEWVPHSTVLASGVDSVCGPLANEGVGLGPSSSGPVASRPPLGLGLLRRPGRWYLSPGRFHAWVSPHGRLASCSSGSLPSRFERLVSLQGASDSMTRFSPVFWSWHSGTDVAPGIVPYSHHGFTPDAGSVCPSLPFPDGSLSLRCLF